MCIWNSVWFHMYFISYMKCYIWYHILFMISNLFHIKNLLKSYMKSYTYDFIYDFMCIWNCIVGMISYMIFYASMLLPGSNAPAACGLFKCNQVRIELSPCSSPKSVSLSTVASKSGCSGLLVHIRNSAQWARTPLLSFPIFVDLFATLLLARIMPVRLWHRVIPHHKLTLGELGVVRVGRQLQDCENDVIFCASAKYAARGWARIWHCLILHQKLTLEELGVVRVGRQLQDFQNDVIFCASAKHVARGWADQGGPSQEREIYTPPSQVLDWYITVHGGGDGIESARKSMVPVDRNCMWRSTCALRDGWSPCAPLGSSLLNYD